MFSYNLSCCIVPAPEGGAARPLQAPRNNHQENDPNRRDGVFEFTRGVSKKSKSHRERRVSS
jgi:hypothetical protein